MVEILLLLLPLVFFAGWRASRRKLIKSQKKQQQLSGTFVKGVNFLLSEEPDKALEVFLNYPDIDEYTAETFQLLGDSFRNRGEVDRALRVHQNLIARTNLKPKQKQKAMFSLGEDFYAAGMLDRAEGVFQELLANTQSNKHISKAAVCSSLRTIYEQTQDWQKAIDATGCFEKSNKKNESSAPELNSKSLVAHYYCELADEALQQGKLNEVDTLLVKVKSVYKQSTRLMTLQGDIEFHQKKYKPALKKYLQAIKQDSRLLSMLLDKTEQSAVALNAVEFLQKELLSLYKKQKNKIIFESILVLAKKYGSSTAIDELLSAELPTEKLNIESIYNSSDYIRSHSKTIDAEQGLDLVNQSLSNYLKGVPAFHCVHCGYKMHDYLWRCPACQEWDTIDHA
jgi:lipopolysaccharide biosynthesis regulator YciM